MNLAQTTTDAPEALDLLARARLATEELNRYLPDAGAAMGVTMQASGPAAWATEGEVQPGAVLLAVYGRRQNYHAVRTIPLVAAEDWPAADLAAFLAEAINADLVHLENDPQLRHHQAPLELDNFGTPPTPAQLAVAADHTARRAHDAGDNTAENMATAEALRLEALALEPDDPRALELERRADELEALG